MKNLEKITIAISLTPQYTKEQEKTFDQEEYAGQTSLQRAADGGSAAGRRQAEWPCEGGTKGRPSSARRELHPLSKERMCLHTAEWAHMRQTGWYRRKH